MYILILRLLHIWRLFLRFYPLYVTCQLESQNKLHYLSGPPLDQLYLYHRFRHSDRFQALIKAVVFCQLSYLEQPNALGPRKLPGHYFVHLYKLQGVSEQPADHRSPFPAWRSHRHTFGIPREDTRQHRLGHLNSSSIVVLFDANLTIVPLITVFPLF